MYIVFGRERARERERERERIYKKKPSDYFSGIDILARLFILIVSRFPPIQIIIRIVGLN